MDLKKINIVAGREYSIRVKKKSFILTTILTPILFAALMIIPSIIMMNDEGEKDLKVVVLDQSQIVAPSLKSDERINYVISPSSDVEEVKKNFADTDAYALVVISPLDEDNNVSVTAYSTKEMNIDIKASIKKSANSAVEAYKLSKYDIKDLDKILNDVKSDVKIDTYLFSEDGQEKRSMVEISMVLSYIMSFFIYMFVFMFGNMVMRSVIDEKQTRIVEVIVSSVKPFDLMLGKIVGVAGVAITQFLIWVVLTLVLVFGFNIVAGKDLIQNQLSSGTEQVSMIAGDEAQNAIEAIASGNSELGGILSAVSQIDFPYILGCFFIYFILGYLLYAAMFAAVGSAVDNEADTQQLTLPITVPLILGLLIMIHTFQHPDSALSFWASIIPFTSPMVMLARIPFEGGVPLWELLLSIGLLFLTFLFTVYLSGKIYRVGILMYGKKATWKDLLTWIKLK